MRDGRRIGPPLDSCADWALATRHVRSRAWIEAVGGRQGAVLSAAGASSSTHARAGSAEPEPAGAGVRNISLDDAGRLKGVAGDEARAARGGGDDAGASRAQARALGRRAVAALTTPQLRAGADQPAAGAGRRRASNPGAPTTAGCTSMRFPSRPNYGERILRVFSQRQSRTASRASGASASRSRTSPRASCRSCQALFALAGEAAATRCGVTKSLRSEYDHLMLQLHDAHEGRRRLPARSAAGRRCRFPPGIGLGLLFRPDRRTRRCRASTCWSRPSTCPPARQYNPACEPAGDPEPADRARHAESATGISHHAPPDGSVRRFCFLEHARHMATIPITKRGAEKLKAELHRLKTVDRPR